ncbi:hypothetical protein WSM22_22000 [Cytophagales bacterium WSM2-2]|nr:hypothetical protein WSM22_22000 [Cytophagales bacterium WSM2-2]
MRRFLAAFGLVGFIYSAEAQIVVSPSTAFAVGSSTNVVIATTDKIDINSPIDFSPGHVDFHLFGAGTLKSTSPITINNLTINAVGNYAVLGQWTVTDDINLVKGKLIVPTRLASTDQLLYTGANLGRNGMPGSDLSYIQGPFAQKDSKSYKTLTYPIGNADGFFPVQLLGVNESNTVLEMECVKDPSPQIPTTGLSADIDAVFNSRYWTLAVSNGPYTGAYISLSLTGVSSFLSDEAPVILEKDAGGTVKDLSNAAQTSDFATSKDKTGATGGTYAVASSKKVEIIIHRIITPNGDDVNETLFIQGIDFYKENKVTFMDRYGATYFEKSQFANYTSKSPQQLDFDYSKLNNGNYICTVEYTDTNGNVRKSKSQMITVIK